MLGAGLDEESYEKRRRNVIVVSLALLAALWANTTVGKLSVFGVEVNPPQHWPLWGYLGVLWVYFLWRFVMLVPTAKGALQNAFDKVFQGHVESYLRKTLPIQHGDRFVAYQGLSGQEPRTWGHWKVRPQVVLTQKDTTGTRTTDVWQTIEGWTFWRMRLRTWFELSFTASPVTDHILPYAIAAVPLVYAFWRWMA